MGFIYVDGSDLPGINALASILRAEYGYMERTWYPPIDSSLVGLADTLKEETKDPQRRVLWVGGWISAFKEDPWLGEWLFGRAVRTCGAGALMVEIGDKEFDQYARRFGYMIGLNLRLDTTLQPLALSLHELAEERSSHGHAPYHKAGPPDAQVVVVGEERRARVLPGGWMPFSGKFTTMMAREFGDQALKMAWCNAADCPPQWLRSAQTVIACGDQAERWAKYHVAHANVIKVHHPSYAYRSKSWSDEYRQKLVLLSTEA